MSKMILNSDKTKGQIQDVTLCYVKLQDGDFAYKSKTEKEYSAVCIVDKTTAKMFKKTFPKNGFKEIDTEDFEDKYKIAPPLPAEDEQFIITLKVSTTMKKDLPKYNLHKGDLVPYEYPSRPKVYVPLDGGVKDITMTTLISNGSKGTMAFDLFTHPEYGTFPRFSGILVTDLIEYKQTSSGCDFGEVVGGYNPGDGDVQQVAGGKEQSEDGGEAPESLNDQKQDSPEEPQYDDNDMKDLPF